MRGETEPQATMLMRLAPDGFVLRGAPAAADQAVGRLGVGSHVAVVRRSLAAGGRPSIPPEQLLKASLLMACYTIRSERQFCEQLRYNILFKWFLDLNVEDEPFHPTTFTKNRERLLEANAARTLFKEVAREVHRLLQLSTDHFMPDGTLLKGWASHKSYCPGGERP